MNLMQHILSSSINDDRANEIILIAFLTAARRLDSMTLIKNMFECFRLDRGRIRVLLLPLSAIHIESHSRYVLIESLPKYISV